MNDATRTTQVPPIPTGPLGWSPQDNVVGTKRRPIVAGLVALALLVGLGGGYAVGHAKVGPLQAQVGTAQADAKAAQVQAAGLSDQLAQTRSDASNVEDQCVAALGGFHRAMNSSLQAMRSLVSGGLFGPTLALPALRTELSQIRSLTPAYNACIAGGA